jgi:hypothetical protein
MPALLKCDVGTFALDAILDVYLTVNFGVVWTSILDLVFGVLPFADLPVYRCFLDLGCWLGPLFRPVLDPVLVRISRHLEIRVYIQPYLNCSDVCLTIRHKSSHLVRVRFLGK